MAKLPLSLRKTEWDTKPTDRDKIGEDGLYIKKIVIAWWSYPYWIIKMFLEMSRRYKLIKRKETNHERRKRI